jgi:hypothetical protein
MSLVLLGILNSQAAAAGGAGAYDLLETQVLTSSASSVTFTGLGSYSDYKHLQIRAVGQAEDVVSYRTLYTAFNSDTTLTNYAYHTMRGYSGSVSSFGAGSNSPYTYLMPGSSLYPASWVMDIYDFASSNKQTTMRYLTGFNTNQQHVAMGSILWNNTAALTSVGFYLNSGNIDAGSRFSLYGVK